MRKSIIMGILWGIFLLYHGILLTLGFTGILPWYVEPPSALDFIVGPGMFFIGIVISFLIIYASRFLPKEAPATGEVKKRRSVLLTSTEAAIIAAFSGINFAWNALGLIIVIFPPGSWSLSGIMPQLVGFATGPVGLVITHFIAGLLWYDFPWGTYNFMLSGTWPNMLIYWYLRDVKKVYRYGLITITTFIFHQYDVWTWAMWAVHFAKLAPVEYIIPATYVFIPAWAIINTVSIVVLLVILDRIAPGLLRPTWLERYATD
jgi:hypothetical protein